MNCPWDGWAPASIKFCGEPVCGWITQPANTWSNAAFVIAGLFIIRLALRERKQSLALIGYSSVLLGFGSGLFHASGTFAFEVLDQMGMFLISGIMIVFNLQRLWQWRDRTIYIFYVVMTLLFVGANIMYRGAGIPLFGFQLTVTLTLETVLYCRDYGKVQYKYLLLFVGSFILAFVCWNLDISGKWCTPGSAWITGHAVWHFFNALAIYYIYRYFRQFKVGETSEDYGSR